MSSERARVKVYDRETAEKRLGIKIDYRKSIFFAIAQLGDSRTIYGTLTLFQVEEILNKRLEKYQYYDTFFIKLNEKGNNEEYENDQLQIFYWNTETQTIEELITD